MISLSDGVRLTYSIGGEAEPQRVDDHVSLQRRPCRFGGARAFFCCPRCGSFVLSLYLGGGRFTCRACGRLTYASRRERARDRHLRAANKLRSRLGGEAGAVGDLPPRPKGMWRRTYDRLSAEIERRENVALEELAGWVMKLGAARSPAARFW